LGLHDPIRRRLNLHGRRVSSKGMGHRQEGWRRDISTWDAEPDQTRTSI